MIHRPKYGDWSLPKGKLEKGEGWREAALREVEEETGYRCEAGVELPHVSYLDRKSRRKLVRYWLMDPIEGKFEPHDEVDELRWVTPAGGRGAPHLSARQGARPEGPAPLPVAQADARPHPMVAPADAGIVSPPASNAPRLRWTVEYGK